MDFESNLPGVRTEILLVTRSVTSIRMSGSYTDVKTIGQIVSSFRVSVVSPNWRTKLEDMRLYWDPVSSKQRTLHFPLLPSISTTTVGSSVTVFCFRIADKEALEDLFSHDFDLAVGFKFGFESGFSIGFGFGFGCEFGVFELRDLFLDCFCCVE